MSPTTPPSFWSKDQFTISTSQAILQPDVVNKAFGSDYMYWTKAMPEDDMKQMLNNSLCFGIYVTTTSSSGYTGKNYCFLPTQHLFVLTMLQTTHHLHKLDLDAL